MGNEDRTQQPPAEYSAPTLVDYGTIEEWTLGRLGDNVITISIIL